MTFRPTTIHRPLSVIIVLALLFGLIAIGPASQAAAEGFEATVFRSDFDDLPTGALGAAPVAVAEGFVLAAPAPVTVATVSGLSGKALTVTGAGGAELRFTT